ncbi:hypothetical protein A2Z22_02530 [Candidatus Woesebacteria bacterium RBG_16_34_12]|uniref:Nudix hydrolase domain-containing protein n=1 Tax=Candidatus Woesebacteria bacterium RBG_16_34_12 TaxID=1802480 RepID=A0A1F7X9G4_9BACT|nr:MAG: hypothetical protein A2Z22_02530 [Candidatus Woesebacteria bacterium RBG_16_34_12]
MKIDKSWYIKPKDKNFPKKEAVGGVVIRKFRNKLVIALIKDKKYRGCILPKGGIENGELQETASRREISEEAGLNKLNFICKLGIKERLTFEKTDWTKTHYFLFLTKQKSGQQELEQGEEDYVLEWFELDNLPSFFWPEQKESVEKNRERIKELLKKAQ